MCCKTKRLLIYAALRTIYINHNQGLKKYIQRVKHMDCFVILLGVIRNYKNSCQLDICLIHLDTNALGLEVNKLH